MSCYAHVRMTMGKMTGGLPSILFYIYICGIHADKGYSWKSTNM